MVVIIWPQLLGILAILKRSVSRVVKYRCRVFVAGCTKLTSVAINLPSLTSAYNMFAGCIKLSSFNAGTEGLKSLSDGTNMFQNCNLDETSVLHVLNTIPTYTSGTHKLHLGKRTNFLDSTEIATLLNTTVPIAASTNYKYKGWTITVQE